jgi:2-polyprenyl-3-methyl-5-hydroxy-6-metoxy-1,4-benzoquinol methylase
MKNIIKRYGYVFSQNDFVSNIEQCPVCGSPKHRRNFFAYINKKLGIHYLMCDHCYAVSSSHYAKNEILNDFYGHYYQLMHREDKKVTIHDCIGFAKHIVKFCPQIRTNGTRNIKILDYGGGNGSVAYNIALNFMRNREIEQIDILVIDYEKNTIKSDCSAISISSKEPNSEISGTFDLIVASAVLEHVVFVKDLYIELFQHVQKNGYFYIRVPYIMPLYKTMQALGIKIEAFFPEHVHDFSKKFFDNSLKTFKQDDFRIIVSQPSYFETSFKENFIRALFSRIIRFPYKFNESYPFVGGWEVIYHRSNFENYNTPIDMNNNNDE